MIMLQPIIMCYQLRPKTSSQYVQNTVFNITSLTTERDLCSTTTAAGPWEPSLRKQVPERERVCVCYSMKEYVGSHQGTVNTFQNSVDVLVKCDSYFAIARLIILLN